MSFISHPRFFVCFLLLSGSTTMLILFILATGIYLDAGHLHQLAVNPAVMTPHG